MGETNAAPRCDIELDAFSGRPNPRWSLTATDCAVLTARLAAMAPGGAGAAPRPPDLGYRGLLIHQSNRVRQRLYGGRLTEDGRQVTAGIDPGRALERWLLDTASGHVPGPVLDFARAAIEAD